MTRHKSHYISIIRLSVSGTCSPTFLLSFAEDGIMVADGHQTDVVVVDDVLRVFEAVVGAQKMIDGQPKKRGKLVSQNDVEDLC